MVANQVKASTISHHAISSHKQKGKIAANQIKSFNNVLALYWLTSTWYQSGKLG
jgi:hypothetical protein